MYLISYSMPIKYAFHGNLLMLWLGQRIDRKGQKKNPFRRVMMIIIRLLLMAVSITIIVIWINFFKIRNRLIQFGSQCINNKNLIYIFNVTELVI